MMKKLILALAMLIWPLVAVAQDAAQAEADRGFIQGLLEDNLSGAGRVVRITGFAGALSSRATFTELTIADDDGIWLTIRDGAIGWNRLALLRRRVEIAELSAGLIQIARPPLRQQDTSLPAATAPDFSLPQLPVAVQIDKIDAARVEIGAPVFGAEAAVRLKGTLSLADGEGSADIKAERLDAARGLLSLKGSYSNASRDLLIDLLLDEDANGIAAGLLDLPDRPAVKLAVAGSGPIDDFKADVRLATDAQDRLSGTVTTARANGPDEGGAAPGRRFRAQLGGDISPLLPPQHRDFFGTASQLLAQGWRGDDGRLSVPVLLVTTGGANLSGALELAPGGAPDSAALMLNVAPGNTPDQRTALPFAGIALRSGALQFTYDRASGEGWILDGRLADVDTGAATLRTLRLSGDGHLASDGGDLAGLDGIIDFAAAGIAPTDPAIAQAVGEFAAGRTELAWAKGGALRIENLRLTGDGFSAEGGIDFESPAQGVIAKAALSARYEDFARLSGLAGRTLGGQAEMRVNGAYTLLTGAFDGRAEITGTDLTVDQEQLDTLLAGASTVTLDARRDAEGIALRGLTIDADQLVARAQGVIRAGATDLTAEVQLTDLHTLDPAYGGTLNATAQLTETGTTAPVRRLTLNGTSDNLHIGIPEVDAALRGTTNLVVIGQESGGTVTIETLRAANPQLVADIKGTLGEGRSDATATIEIPDLAALGRDWAGALKADAVLKDEAGTRHLTMTGTGENLRLGQQDVDGALTGTTAFDLSAFEKDGVYTVERLNLTNAQMQAAAQGTIGGGQTDATARLNIANLAAFGRGWRGAVQADATFAEDGTGARRLTLTGTGDGLSLGQANVDGALTGRTDFTLRGVERDGLFTIDEARIANPRLRADATGKVGAGQSDLAFNADVADLAPLGLGLRGGLTGRGTLTSRGDTLTFAATGTGRNLAIGQPEADRILAGTTSFDLAGGRDAGVLRLDRLRASNPQITVTGDGVVDGGTRRVNVDARLANLGLLAPDFPGPATVAGTIAETGRGYDLNLRATAPGNSTATITGPVAADFRSADVAIRGATDAALLAPMTGDTAVAGPITFDLRLNGAPSLAALSGRVRADALRVANPGLRVSLPRVALSADLAGGRAVLDGRAEMAEGGTILLSGPVTLGGAFPADLGITITDARLRDPQLYQTRVFGDLRLTGPLTGGATLAGKIDVWEAEIRIPSTGLGSSTLLTGVEHRGDPAPVRATRARARLDGGPAGASERSGSGRFALDVTIDAPNEIFVRGRGLDAELGGQIRIGGDTASIRPSGGLELIRGRLDILGKRLDLDEGRIDLDGALIPTIRFVASTTNDAVTSFVTVEGRANEPTISFTSNPDMPEEEVIAQLLFSRNLANISAFQAAQLASAIATLAGRGGEGIVGKVRGSFGLDDLDVSADDEGAVTVRAGKYLSKNVYTDVEVDSAGDSRLNLNLDITPSLKARGSVGASGGSSLGLFFERDY